MKHATIEHTEHGLNVWLENPTLTELLVTIETLHGYSHGLEDECDVPVEKTIDVEIEEEAPVENVSFEFCVEPTVYKPRQVTYPTIPEGLVDAPYGDYKLTIK